MSKLLLFAGSVLAAPLLYSAAPGVELGFAVADDTELTLTASRILTLELGDSEMTMVFDGEEQEGAGPEIELTIIESESIAFTDVYSGVKGGRAARIERSFEEVTTQSIQKLVTPEGDEEDTETPGKSELEGASVIFVWDADEEEYSASFAEGSEDLDEELLEGLDAVADFTCFLPEGEVDEDESWELDIDAFRRLSAIAGELDIVREGEEDLPDDDFGEQFDDNLSGTLSGTFKGIREEDGRRLAVLYITGELETNIEQSEEIETEGGEGESTETYEFSFELEGNLLWDIEGGHAHSFEFSGDCSMTLTGEQSMSGEGHEIAFTTVQEFEGDVLYEITFE